MVILLGLFGPANLFRWGRVSAYVNENKPLDFDVIKCQTNTRMYSEFNNFTSLLWIFYEFIIEASKLMLISSLCLLASKLFFLISQPLFKISEDLNLRFPLFSTVFEELPEASSTRTQISKLFEINCLIDQFIENM